MTKRITKLQRWLDLIAFLVKRRLPVPVEEVMKGVPAYAEKWVDGDETAQASVRRMFERDKDELRAAGIPLETVERTVCFGWDTEEGYRLSRRDFYLPYLKLVGELSDAQREPAAEAAGADRFEIEGEDARTALEALRDAAALPSFPLAAEARSAFRKLAFDMDPDRLLGDSPVLYVDRPGAEEIAGTVRLLSDALLARKRVRFRYHGIYRGRTTERDVAPYGLLFQRGHWYLVGHDATRDGLRVFRVGRMEGVEVNTRRRKTPDYEIPDTFRLDDYLDRDAWELGGDDGEPLRARVRFRFPSSLWAERNGRGELVEAFADGSAVRAFDVHQVNPFLRWLLSFQGEAEVEGPPELAAEFEALAAAVAGVYEGEAHHG